MKQATNKAAVESAPVPVIPDPVIEVHNGLSLCDAVRSCFEEASNDQGKLTEYVLNIDGMSGKKFRYFLNNLMAKVSNPRYLEVGSWAGSTFCSAIFGNTLRAVAIDNWSQFGGPVNHFFINLANCTSVAARTSVIFEDFRKVDFGALGKFNVYLFDGPHAYEDQYDGLIRAWNGLTEEFVFIVDDWNWDAVRAGTMDAIRDLGLEVQMKIEVRTTQDNSHPAIGGKQSDWHNGYFISVLRKNGAVSQAA
jgi:hypothetical protein